MKTDGSKEGGKKRMGKSKTKASSDSVLPAPPRHRDGQWQEKIEVAKQARVQGIQARKGKKAAFVTRQLGSR